MSKLQDAFREAMEIEFSYVPPENEIEWDFSPAFLRKMNRLIHAQEHGYWKVINTAAKRVACVAAAIIILLSSVMAIRPIRERVIQFFIETFDEYFQVRFGENEADDLYTVGTPMTPYTFTRLPEGYEHEE